MSDVSYVAMARSHLTDAEVAATEQMGRAYASAEYRLGMHMRLAEVNAKVAQAEALSAIADRLDAILVQLQVNR